MKNYVSDGDTLTFTAGAAYSSGDGVLLGSLFGFATGDIANGAEGVLLLEGVFTHAKAASQAWSVGAKVYWDDTNKVLTTTASGNTLVGVATLAVAGGASDTTGTVRLNGTV
jgi:predicted RecA/RadA family phage recombinase